jgi:hypothetical protein
MSQDDPRAFRDHLTGRDLFRAQERLIAAILRAPSLSPVIRLAGLNRHHFPFELATAFDFALRSDKDEIRRAVQNGGDDVGRLYRLGVELNHAQARQLARQIQESIARQRPSQTQAPDADDSMDYVMPVLTVEARSHCSRNKKVVRFRYILESASFSFLNQPENPQIMLVLRGNANFASLRLFEETSRK